MDQIEKIKFDGKIIEFISWTPAPYTHQELLELRLTPDDFRKLEKIAE